MKRLSFITSLGAFLAAPLSFFGKQVDSGDTLDKELTDTVAACLSSMGAEGHVLGMTRIYNEVMENWMKTNVVPWGQCFNGEEEFRFRSVEFVETQRHHNKNIPMYMTKFTLLDGTLRTLRVYYMSVGWGRRDNSTAEPRANIRTTAGEHWTIRYTKEIQVLGTVWSHYYRDEAAYKSLFEARVDPSTLQARLDGIVAEKEDHEGRPGFVEGYRR